VIERKPIATAVVRRLLPAPPDVVYEEWLDPEALMDWMCPRPARCLNVELEPRVGGRLHIDIEDNGVEFAVTGRFTELERPRRLRFTWHCSTWTDPALESVVTVSLDRYRSTETMMTIEHDLLPVGLADQHRDGWDAIGSQLERSLGRRRSSAEPDRRQPTI
jgi:uncharacterized protein YndB with AHSA1/START domain